jgi:hypothetical protein
MLLGNATLQPWQLLMQVKFLWKHLPTLCCSLQHGVTINTTTRFYLGSLSDPAKDCGFLEKLNGMSGISIMADRGFAVKEELSKIGVGLNLPPFKEGRGQLPADEMQHGRSIASLRIHVESAIGRMKQYKVITGVFPLKISRIANQIVCSTHRTKNQVTIKRYYTKELPGHPVTVH